MSASIFAFQAGYGGRRAMLLIVLAALAGCDGENRYQVLPTGTGGRADVTLPTVDIQSPLPRQRAAVRDSVLVQVSLRDQQGLRAVEIRGFSVRGSARLGTQTVVDRFLPKQVQFDTVRAVRDVTVARYLVATPDSMPEDTVLIVVSAEDRSGNVRSDTVAISLGGPRVQLISPAAGSQVRAGARIRTRVTASSPGDPIQSLTVRADSAFARDTTLRFDPAVTAVDTVLSLVVPADAVGTLRLRAIARTATNDTAATPAWTSALLPASRDQRPPVVRFRVTAPARAERTDEVSVSVAAFDSMHVAQVGASVRAIHRLPGRTDTLGAASLVSSGDSATFRFSLEQLGVPLLADTSTVRLEITAFARDADGNCATSTVPATPLSEPCDVGEGGTFAPRTGARYDILMLLGRTLQLPDSTDVIADIASDGSYVFLSNRSENRLDVFEVGADRVTESVSVGSRPWGLALSPDRATLFVANSGGTNISVVDVAMLEETDRIQTPNVKLYDVTFTTQRAAVAVAADTSRRDSVTIRVPGGATRYDYSDKPQYIGVTARNNLVYSTLPTPAAPNGTLRIYRADQDRLEILTEYAEDRVDGKVVISNADSVMLVADRPYNRIRVCPRNRSTDPDLDRKLPKRCFLGHLGEVQDSLAEAGYDTRFHYNLDIGEVGLSDTTFVAVSRDHSTIAFAEGARSNGRIMLVEDPIDGAADEPLLKFGEIRDIVGNTAERIIGLALNADGSRGMARGAETFFFDRELRLQGTAATGGKSGGIDMHPDNTGSGLSFVSGVTSAGLAYIDVIDTFTYRRTGRIFLRDRITGPLRAVETYGGTMIYAVTARGVVEVPVP